jgi:hypothetical protein
MISHQTSPLLVHILAVSKHTILIVKLVGERWFFSKRPTLAIIKKFNPQNLGILK